MVNTARQIQKNTAPELAIVMPAGWIAAIAMVGADTTAAAPKARNSAHDRTRDCWRACAVVAVEYRRNCAANPAIGASRPKNTTKLIGCG
jgi:hypothetical protein